MNYQKPRNKRREQRTLVGRFRSGRLNPVLVTAVRGNESGMLSQSITLELDPIAGRPITPIWGEVVSVFVPVQAIDALKNPAADYAGMTEVLREKLLSGAPLFGLEAENEISQRCGVNPRAIGDVKMVNEAIGIGHNAAVNHLRQRKYHKATPLGGLTRTVTSALLGQTILERLNAVLDPEDRVNGMVNFQTGTITAPLTGALAVNNLFTPTVNNANRPILQDATNPVTVISSEVRSRPMTSVAGVAATTANSTPLIHRVGGPVPNVDLSSAFANLSGLNVGSVSLTDFYNAEKMDKLTRMMREIQDANPEYGDEIVLRWVHGLNVDGGKVPYVIYQKTMEFGKNIVPAMDSGGVTNDLMRSDMMLQTSFTVPVPKTELGGLIYTFCVVKPDETLATQPHPILSDVWGLDNFVADELALDPVPVTIREINSNALPAQQTTVVCYTGLNALKANYIHYGLARNLNPTTIENKTVVWQIEIPASVSPDSILYPTLVQYPFADQNAEICRYAITSSMVLDTPMIIGPTPVEELALIEDADIFEDQ